MLLEADGADQLLARVVGDHAQLLPLVLLDALEGGQALEVLLREGAGVEGEGEPPHEALLAVLRPVPA